MAKNKAPKTKNRFNGEGSFYYDKSKQRWYGVVTIGYDANDKPIRRKVSDKDHSNAMKKFDELKEQVRKGTLVEKDSTRLEDVIMFQIERDRNLNIIKDVSYIRRKETLDIIKKSNLSRLPLQDIDEVMLIAYLNTITHYSQSTIRKVYGQINSAFKYGQSKDIVYKNPLSQVKMPKSKKPTKKVSALTVSEQQQFVNALNSTEIDNPYRYIFLLMLLTGMRCGECCALKVNDINFNFRKITINKTITVDKNGKPILGDVTKTENGMRTITITEPIEKLLREIISTRQENRMNLLFYDNANDKVIATARVNDSFKRLVARNVIIDSVESYLPLSAKNRATVRYRKYTFYEKQANGEFVLLGREAPEDWKLNFAKYYYIHREAYKPYNLHMLRHTFATRCIESGMPAKVLQKILGHADIETTLNTYCDVFEEYENKAVMEAEKYMNQLKLIS